MDTQENGLVTPTLQTKREALGLPDRQSVDVALAFAEIARKDLRASRILYLNKLYPQAVFELEQAVEKSVKGVGLLMNLVTPSRESLTHEAGHSTVLRILLGRRERLARLAKNLGALAASEGLKEGRDLLLKLGVPPGIPESSEMESNLKDETNAKEEADYIARLKSNDLWKITLEADPRRPPNTAILKMLENAESRWTSLDRLQRKFEQKLAPRMSDPETLEYILNVYGRAFPEIAPLSLVTMWHERETRYPPLEGTDYWDPGRYVLSSGLVKLYPRLMKHAKRLCEGAVRGASAARAV